MKKSIPYRWITISGWVIGGLVVMPLIAYNYFTDANVQLTRHRSFQEGAHIVDSSDIGRVPWIRDYLEFAEKVKSCPFTYADPLCPYSQPPLKVYQVDSVAYALQLTKYEPYEPGNVYYYGNIGYMENYYTIRLESPEQEFVNYLFYGLITSIIGSVSIALILVKFRAGRSKAIY